MNRNAIGLIVILASTAWLTGQATSGPGTEQKQNSASPPATPRIELLTKPPIRFSHKEDKEKKSILQGTLYVRRAVPQGNETLSISGAPAGNAARVQPKELSTSTPAELTITLPVGCQFAPARLAWHGRIGKPDLCKPAGGHLLLTSSAANLPDQLLPFEWTLSPRFSRDVEASIFTNAFIMAVLAVVVGIIIAWAVGKEVQWTLVGDSNWDLSKSWATNATIGTSLLTGVLALVGFPEQPAILPKPEYAFFSLWTASLVGIGAAAYSAFTWPAKSDARLTGFVPLFALSATLIMWAAIIQLYVLLLIVAELALANVLGPDAEWTLCFVLRLSLAGVVAYGVYGVQGVLLRKRDRDDTKAGQVTTETVKRPATWSQL